MVVHTVFGSVLVYLAGQTDAAHIVSGCCCIFVLVFILVFIFRTLPVIVVIVNLSVGGAF